MQQRLRERVLSMSDNGGKGQGPRSTRPVSNDGAEFATHLDHIETDPTKTVSPLPSVQRRIGQQDAFQSRLQSEIEPASPLEGFGSAGVGHTAKKGVPFAAKVLLAMLLVAAVVVGAIALVSWISSNGRRTDGYVPDNIGASVADAVQQADVEPSYLLVAKSEGTLATSKSGERTVRSGASAEELVLVRADLANAKMTLVSIPADTLVTGAKGRGVTIGSLLEEDADTLMDAVRELAGVDVAHYVVVDDDALSDARDVLEGRDADEDDDDASGTSSKSGETSKKGSSKKDTAQKGSDTSDEDDSTSANLGEKLLQKAVAADDDTLSKLAKVVADGAVTDVRAEDVVTLVETANQMGDRLITYVGELPTTTTRRGKTLVDADPWRTMMQRVDAGLAPDGTSAIPHTQANDSRLGAATNAVTE